MQNFLSGCPQTPLDGSYLRCSIRLFPGPSNGPDLLPYDVYLLVTMLNHACIYMVLAAVILTCRLELLTYPSHTYLKEALKFSIM